MKDLVRSHLIIGTSGKGGGYKLSRPPEDYTVGEIIELMEGTLAPVACLADGNPECPRKDICKTRPLWVEYYSMKHNFFYSKKLCDLL